jgi:hypothetical protein
MKRSGKNKKIIVHPSTIKLLTETTWNFAHAVLWQSFPFSKEEVELAKLYIKEYYEAIPAKRFQQFAIVHFRNYRAYVRLAKKYISRLPLSYLAKPSVWLDRKQVKRFCNTRSKHFCMLKKRNGRCVLSEKCIACCFPFIATDFHFTT